MVKPLLESDLPGVPLLFRGKVRDVYDLGDQLLLVATDRLSAFDVVLPTAIPAKGALLTQLSAYWFRATSQIIPNHLISAEVADYPAALQPYAEQLAQRSMLVKKARRIDVECVVRGYITGSAWSEYRRQGTVAGVRLPAGLRESEAFPEPMFTPSTKADTGHDENISVEQLRGLVGDSLTERLARASIDLYRFGHEHARARGIILADTKFEFGFLPSEGEDGELILIDEALTPDSSRFWSAAEYEVGRSQASFDKQYVRDWLSASGWNKEPPAPELPREVVERTAAKYREAYDRLTSQ
jgi:phosphoribosylaminoimidazole-succinocarboxamide synthase